MGSLAEKVGGKPGKLLRSKGNDDRQLKPDRGQVKCSIVFSGWPVVLDLTQLPAPTYLSLIEGQLVPSPLYYQLKELQK